MSDVDINSMSFKQLKNEVQELRDTVTRMKRMYEDILYNLDDDNFSSRFVKEKNGMKAEIKITAEEISSVVENVEGMSSTVTQTAGAISTLVTTVGGAQSTIRQTADIISTAVSGVDGLSTRVDVAEDKITTIVSGDGDQSIFKQTDNGFYFDGDKIITTGKFVFSDNPNGANPETFSLFRSTATYDQFIMRGFDSNNKPMPLVIGDYNLVYIGSYGDGNEVATRSWVQENSYAKFG